MRSRVLVSLGAASTIALVATASLPVSGQSGTPALVITAYNGGTPASYTVPKTPWGDPDPGPHATPFGAVAACVSPDFQEGVLGEVFGRLAFAHHPVGEGEGGAVVAVVERGERLGVRRLDEGDQVLVGKNKVLSSPVRHTLILR